MIKNRDLPAYFFILLVSTFLTCSVDAQEKAENKIYADEHMQFLLPEKFRGESDTEKPFQVCLTDDAGSRIYFAVRKRADKTIAGGITNEAGNITAAEKKIAVAETLIVSDYGSKLWGLQKQKINWIRMQRSEDSNDCLFLAGERNGIPFFAGRIANKNGFTGNGSRKKYNFLNTENKIQSN